MDKNKFAKAGMLLLLALVFGGGATVHAQGGDFERPSDPRGPIVVSGVIDPDAQLWERHHINERLYLSYEKVRESDVMWQKTIWRQIDFKEKMNLPFYFPYLPDTTNAGLRRNLINTMIWGIENDWIIAYKPDDYHEFQFPRTMEEIYVDMGGGADTIMVPDMNDPSIMIPTVTVEEPKVGDVYSIIVKEVWFFDRHRSQLEARIVGICPIIDTYRETDFERLNPTPKKLFWIYYPDSRDLFSSQEVFNVTGNDAERRTFDDIFVKRFFSSYIIGEANIYNNRRILEYTLGVEALLEAERIKEEIFNYEQDLWEY